MNKVYFFIILFAPLFLTAQTQKLPPIVEWQKYLGGSRDDRANSVIPTADHGFLIVGYANSNDGAITDHHGPVDSSDAWVVKLNGSGNIQWKKSYGGTNYDEFKHAIQASNGDFICVGTTRSADGDVTGLHTSSGVASDLWVVRINREGVIQWSKVFGGSNEEHGQVIRKTADGNYLIGGDAQSNDFDVTNVSGAADMWVLKINDQGTLLWQKTYGNPNAQFVNSITATSDNNYVLTGYQLFRGYPANSNVPTNAKEKAIVKINEQGTVLWDSFPLFNQSPTTRYNSNLLKAIELPTHDILTFGPRGTPIPFTEFNIFNSSNGHLINNTIGRAANSSQFNSDVYLKTGPDMAQLLSDSSVITCASLLSDTLNKQATLYRFKCVQNTGGAPRYDYLYTNFYNGQFFNGINALQDEEYIAAGSILINQQSDFLVVKFNGANQIKGRVFIDNNGNAIKDAGETYFKNGLVESRKNGDVVISALDASGAFLNAVDTGTYNSTVILGGNSYYTVNPASKTTIFRSFNNIDSFDFAMVPVGVKNDLKISLQAITAMRPGFEATYRIDYSNIGTSVIGSTVIKFVKPGTTSFVSATLAPSSITGDTVLWNIGSLSPFDASYLNVVLRSGAPPVVNIGDELKLSALINPVDGDLSPLNNADTLHQTVRGSFDPNDKQENHDGSLYFAQLQAGQSLTYTVRFQNMGTDTAFNIIVKDTVSDKLDVSTFEIVGASHPYQVNIKDNKYATFAFNDIMLPDHNINETASHGYITYRIKPKSNVQLGDRIYNSASIYFDYNLPVQTNKHETTVRLIPVPTPVISGLQLSYCGKQGAQSAKILNLPASTSGITVTAKLDATVLTIAADSTVSFTVSSVAAGTHNFTVTYSTVTDVITTTASIVITAVAAPDVNLSANITNVGNLANSVIVTATNERGGGKNPLYTFAWNNSFTNIIQAESSNNAVSIPASSLSLGDNKVYVKMKTSENCYSALENIDSINIRRDVSTGIIDPESPGQVITVYPNPVHGPVTVYGLITSKTYTFTIVNLQGQAVFSKRVANQSTANINDFKSAAGMYWLTIYDEKNNRTLGTVKLIKQ